MDAISISPLVATSFMNDSASPTSKSPTVIPLMYKKVQAARLDPSTSAVVYPNWASACSALR
jgi:hypothetical protein